MAEGEHREFYRDIHEPDTFWPNLDRNTSPGPINMKQMLRDVEYDNVEMDNNSFSPEELDSLGAVINRAYITNG